MDSPYFLTRQTANLMEDFARELAAGSALYLLYGEPRVGKTRLLEELRISRLSDRNVHWIDLANTPDDIAGADLSGEIEGLFEQAAQGDVIVADHFELALKKTRHQLFLSWSTDGVDKGLNLIVASNLEGFNELRQLSQQYQVRVQSYQLMPLDGEETEAFLAHYLFPDHPLGKLSMPAPLRRQVAEARGVIGSLVELADHDGSHIETAPLADSDSLRSGRRVIAAVLLLFALAVGIGWYFFAEPEPTLVEIPLAPAPVTDDGADTATAPVPAIESAATQAAGATDAAPASADLATPSDGVPGDDAQAASADTGIAAVESGPVDAAPPADESHAEDTDAVVDGMAGDPDAGSPDDAAPATAAAPDVAADPARDDVEFALAPDEVAPIVDQVVDASATARRLEPEAGEDPASGETADAQAASSAVARLDAEPPAADAGAAPHDRLLRELQRSLDWLYARDEERGTIQVLLLSFDGFDPAGYFDYVDNLGRSDVDTEQLRIVKTFTGGKTVYSVFFGEYESRRAALRAIDELPEALGRSGPIPRSLGGIWQEIRRLPDEN